MPTNLEGVHVFNEARVPFAPGRGGQRRRSRRVGSGDEPEAGPSHHARSLLPIRVARTAMQTLRYKKVEARPGIEPGCKDLQSSASPLRHRAKAGADARFRGRCQTPFVLFLSLRSRDTSVALSAPVSCQAKSSLTIFRPQPRHTLTRRPSTIWERFRDRTWCPVAQRTSCMRCTGSLLCLRHGMMDMTMN